MKNRLRYFGQLEDGTPSGDGTMTWKDGQIYKGTKNIYILSIKTIILERKITSITNTTNTNESKITSITNTTNTNES